MKLLRILHNSMLFLIIVLLLPIQILAGETQTPILQLIAGNELQGREIRYTYISADNKSSAVFTSVVNKQHCTLLTPDATSTSLVVMIPGYKRVVLSLPLADTTIINTQQYRYQTEEIVVTGGFTPTEAKKAPYRVQVMNAEYIRERQVVTLRDLMTQQMNVRLQQDNILGTNIQMQGIGGEGVMILLDGVPLIGRLNGILDLSQIPLSGIERVEIIEGPMAVQYGADALGGVINLISKKVHEGTSLSATAELYAESVGIVNPFVSVSGILSNWKGLIRIGRNFFGGFSPPPDSFRRWAQWKPREQYIAEWQLGYSLSENTTFRYDGKLFNELILNRGEPRAPYRETAFDDKFRTFRQNHTLSVESTPQKELRLLATANFSTFSREKNSYVKNLVTLEERPSANPQDHDTSSFTMAMARLVAHHTITENVEYQAGIETTADNVTGRRIRDGCQDIYEAAFFTTGQIRIFEHIVVSPGLRYTYNSRYGAPLVPSVHLLWNPANFNLRASYGKGFRAPSLRELELFFVDINHNVQGNPSLQAETSDNLQASLQSTFSIFPLLLRPEIRVFRNDIRNLITLAQVSGDLYSYVNVGEFTTQGINATVELIAEDISVQAGVGIIGRRTFFANLPEASIFRYSPEIIGSVQWQTPLQGLRLSAFVKYTGTMPTITVDNQNTILPGEVQDFTLADLTLSFAPTSYLTLGTGVKNIFNITNITSTLGGGTHGGATSSSQSISWGRSIFLHTLIQF